MSEGFRHGTDISAHPELQSEYWSDLSAGPGQVVDGLLILSGLYMAISPWVVNFASQSHPTLNNVIVGLALAALGLRATTSLVRTKLALVATAIGIWEIVSPWVMRPTPADGGTRIWVNNLVIGIVAALFGLVAAGIAMRHSRS